MSVLEDENIGAHQIENMSRWRLSIFGSWGQMDGGGVLVTLVPSEEVGVDPAPQFRRL